MELCMGEVFVIEFTTHGMRGAPGGDISTAKGVLSFPVRNVQLLVPWGLSPIHCKLAIKQKNAVHRR